MNQADWLAEQFEQHRSHLRAVAYRMLSSLHEADDAVQEAWLRLNRSDVDDVENLGGWLTTVVSRVCLDMLRSRKSRREERIEPTIPEIKADLSRWLDPEQEAIMADSVGLALLVVLDTLSPNERLAFLLHDVFGMSFDEIGPIVERTPATAKKLASRARQRIQGDSETKMNRTGQRKVAQAFLTAIQSADLNALLGVLHPDVVRRADHYAVPAGVELQARGAERVARETMTNAALIQHAHLALLNGTVGLIVILKRRMRVAVHLEIQQDKIKAIQIIADPAQLRSIQLGTIDA